MIWMKWLPWRFIIRRMAQRQGFLDPIALVASLQRFSQPSEVAAPTELLRSGAVLHARGLMNSQAIQHNLDWVWPFWVERQFNPHDKAFVPRAFSITHINLTHRNWTAVGLPDTTQWPIIDPRGLVTPFHDSWSLDFWIIGDDGQSLFPSRLESVEQTVSTTGNLIVTTTMEHKGMTIQSTVQVVGGASAPVCRVDLVGRSDHDARLAVTVRPYNPEGISLVHDITWIESARGWRINNAHLVCFDDEPEQQAFSYYRKGDVRGLLSAAEPVIVPAKQNHHNKGILCEVGLATAAALFRFKKDEARTVTLHIPLTKADPGKVFDTGAAAAKQWDHEEPLRCRLKIPEEKYQYLFDVAIRTLILHSPGDVFPGPFTYKRFWFRDAAFILNAMLCVGFHSRSERVLDRFPSRQKQFGYFLSQEGEWDSNGEALWILQRYCQLTGKAPKAQWRDAIYKGGQWIIKKRLPDNKDLSHGGLLPAGFSAEHLGPNDFYYWDDFWGIAGLNAAGYLARAFGDIEKAKLFEDESGKFAQAVARSIQWAESRLGIKALPAAPYRRLDAGAIGSLVADYPLAIYTPGEERILGTTKFLLDHCFVTGGFFQDMTHSGINPYLTLHIAQILLRAGDPRYADLMRTVAQLASSTGQWPEAVHPITRGGCMGDGQHVWAAAEWVMMVRNCFVREELQARKLVLCSGVAREWLGSGREISFGPTSTPFGDISVRVTKRQSGVHVEWDARWFAEEPVLEVRLPGYPKVIAPRGSAQIIF